MTAPSSAGRPAATPDSEYPIVLLHGVHRTAHSMRSYERAFTRRGRLVLNLGYPSIRFTLEESAELLAEKLVVLEGRQFDLVVHSMGGLVARSLLARHAELRVRRLVMVGTPNQGSELAARFQRFKLYRRIYGKAAKSLPSDSEFVAALPPPRCEFGIIAGGRGRGRGMVPWIPGDNDGLVSVKSARLEGAKDFILVRVNHRRQLRSREVIRQILHFLEHGRFAREE